MYNEKEKNKIKKIRIQFSNVRQESGFKNIYISKLIKLCFVSE